MKHAKRRPDDSTARGWPCPATSATSAAPAGPSSGAALAIRGGLPSRHATPYRKFYRKLDVSQPMAVESGRRPLALSTWRSHRP
jgi:hypothetical protein